MLETDSFEILDAPDSADGDAPDNQGVSALCRMNTRQMYSVNVTFHQLQ